MKKTEQWIRWFQLLGVALFVFIVSQLDLRLVVHQFAVLQVEWLTVYVACFFLTVVFKTARWRVALQAQNVHVRFPLALRIALISSFLGIVSPGRVGEASKIIYLSREDVPVSKSLVSVLLDRLYDVLFLIIFGLIGLTYFAGLFFSEIVSLIVFISATALVGIAIYLLRRRVWDTIKRVVRKFVSTDTYESLAAGWGDFKSRLLEVGKKTVGPMTLFTALSYAFFFPQVYAVARGFGLELSFFYLMFCLALATLISLLPISIGGLGTREATFVGVLGRIGVNAETAVLISFMDGVVLSLLVTGILTLGAMILVKGRKDHG